MNADPERDRERLRYFHEKALNEDFQPKEQPTWQHRVQTGIAALGGLLFVWGIIYLIVGLMTNHW